MGGGGGGGGGCMLSTLPCSSFWHSVIPTSYLIFTLVYSTVLYMYIPNEQEKLSGCSCQTRTVPSDRLSFTTFLTAGSGSRTVFGTVCGY